MKKFIHICKTGDIKKVKALIEGVDPSAFDNLALQRASEDGHVNVVKLLLADPRVDPSANDNYPIRSASFYGHVDVVKLLLAEPTVDPYHAFFEACLRGKTDIVRLLLTDSRIDPSEKNNNAVYSACMYNYPEVVKVLLQDPRVDASDVLELKYASQEIKELLAQWKYHPSRNT